MPQDPKKTSTCPYWSDHTQKCGMHDDGLFIPLENYVETYCSSRKHIGCQHLTGSSTTIRDTAMAEKIRALHSTIVGCKH